MASRASGSRTTGLSRWHAVVTALLLVLAAGCGPGAARVTAPRPGPTAAAACGAVTNHLPDQVAGQDRREVTSSGAYAAAWGDPAIILRCGVERPETLRPSSSCFEVNKVGWFAERHRHTVVFTTIGRAAYVEVRVPSAQRPESAALVDLAGAIRHDPLRSRCL